jgi:two-component sensor histidine kinase
MRYLFILFLLGTAPMASAQNSSPAEDSLLQLIARSPSDSLTMQWYNQLRRLVIYDNPEKALEYCQKYGEFALKAGLMLDYAGAKFYEANSYIPMGKYEQALESLLEAEPYFQEFGETRKLGSLHNSIGAVFESMERDSLALVYFQRSYQAFEEIGDEKRQAMALNNLSNIYYRQGDYEASKGLIERAIDLTDTDEDKQRRRLNYANTLIALNEYELAMQVYRQLLDQEGTMNEYNKCLSFEGLGKLYNTTGDYKNAVLFLTKSLAIAEPNNFAEQKLEILGYLSNSYEAMGEFERAFRYFKAHRQLKDELSGMEKDRNLVNALTRFETEKKEKEIVLLQRDKALASRNQWVLGLGALLFLLVAAGIGVLLWYRSRSYHRLEEKNRVISKMLEEKEFLIKEIHHRVKNNLQVISSLLQLQSRYVEEPTALAALNEGESRVRSMSIIHHHLYTKENLSQVNVAQYIDSLCDSLLDSYNYKKQDIQIHRKVEPLALDVAVMIPLGLIVNELITNAFKYAFEGRGQGQIWVELREESGQLLVVVKDDGVGMPPESARRGFGTRLINTFLRKLEGQAETFVNGGTEVRLSIQAYQDNAAKSQAS